MCGCSRSVDTEEEPPTLSWKDSGIFLYLFYSSQHVFVSVDVRAGCFDENRNHDLISFVVGFCLYSFWECTMSVQSKRDWVNKFAKRVTDSNGQTILYVSTRHLPSKIAEAGDFVICYPRELGLRSEEERFHATDAIRTLVWEALLGEGYLGWNEVSRPQVVFVILPESLDAAEIVKETWMEMSRRIGYNIRIAFIDA